MAEPTGPEQEPDDIWLATDAEAKGVGDPAGRIISRRVPELPGGDASDTADLVALLIPLGIWAVRGIAESVPRVLRRRRLMMLQAQAEQGATDA